MGPSRVTSHLARTCALCILRGQWLSYTFQNTAERTRENRLRRMAKRQGLMLRKSRRRDERAYDFGQFWLIDGRHNVLVFGDSNLGATIDEIESYLTREVVR